jgi:Zn-dependent M28 family amino/carboxypeptidase
MSSHISTRRRGWTLVTATALAAGSVTAVAASAEADGRGHHWSGSERLQHDVKLFGVMRHLGALQYIANHSDGNRASGLPGHETSAAYVYHRLHKAGYDVKYQQFDFDRFQVNTPTVFEQTAPTATTYEEGTDYYTAEYTGNGEGTGTVVEVDVTEPPGPEASSNSSGCEAEDFADFPAGAIALLQRGTCEFGLKAQNASEAGAAGAVIYNEGTPNVEDRNDVLNPTLAGYTVTIPVVGVDYELGRDLVGTTVHLATDISVIPSTTRNVIAETKGGDAESVVMLGGHLDSVPEGPGINDNGSGSAALLEVAEEFARTQPVNKVRFAFWGAEEAGLLGSTEYVYSLTDAEHAAIKLYLNFDMIGSPNYFRGVYDGNGSSPDSIPSPEGSAAIEALFNDYFTARHLPFEDTAFDGRSDYQAFIDTGIPAGGLFTGAEDDKTAEQVALYGGIEGDYDPCYHQACDSFSPVQDGADTDTYRALRRAYGKQLFGNINTFALDTSADAIAHAVATYAFDTSSVEATAATAGSAGLAATSSPSRAGGQEAA